MRMMTVEQTRSPALSLAFLLSSFVVVLLPALAVDSLLLVKGQM